MSEKFVFRCSDIYIIKKYAYRQFNCFKKLTVYIVFDVETASELPTELPNQQF